MRPVRKTAAKAAAVGKKEGRPPFAPTEKDRQMVKVMIAGGMTQERICPVLGITAKTLQKYFRAEMTAASGEADAAVVASLHRMATKGNNVAASIWWTKTRMRWSEKLVVEGEGDFGLGKLVEVLEARRRKADDAA